MAKSQLRSNKEAKKPKKEQKKVVSAGTSTFSKGIAASGDTPKKKA
jgi:hypothetical protein